MDCWRTRIPYRAQELTLGAAVVAFQTVGSWQLDRAGLDEPADASATVGVCITLDVGPTQASEGAVRIGDGGRR